VLAAVTGEVPIMAVDHCQARAHEARELEDGDAGSEREGGVCVAQVVGPANRLDAGGALRRSPLAGAEVVQIDVTAAWGRDIFPVQLSAWFFLGAWFLYQLVEANFGLFGSAANGGGVAFFAHVGGVAFGAIVAWLLTGAGLLAPQDRSAALRAPA
jgi:hypothetical protein